MGTSQYHYDGVESIDLKEWLATDPKEWNEYIRVIPNKKDRTLTLYRLVGESGSGDVVKTVVRDVSFNFRKDSNPKVFNLHYGKADTLLAFLTCLKWERTPVSVSVDYYKVNNSPMIEEKGLNCESIYFKYGSESGNSQLVEISDMWKNDMQTMAKF